MSLKPPSSDDPVLITPLNDIHIKNFDQERERIHRQMLSSVSHDLKTPLASIIGSLEVFDRMKEKLTVDKQATLIQVALQEAYRLDNFITNILDMAKLENGMVKPRLENIDVGSMIKNCLLRLNNRLQNSQVNVQNFLDAPFSITTDPMLLSRVVCLVLDNAVKYGGKTSIINIEYGKAKEDVGYIKIHDNGSGILPDQMEVIFSKYTRFSKEDQQNAGTGLGLAIGSAIMKLLGGGIMATSEGNAGSFFTLSFPA